MRFFQGWSDLQSSLIPPLPLELILLMRHYSKFLDLLERIRGYFHLVCDLPPNATWTSHLRSRRFLLGLEDLDPEASPHVLHANACCECSAWISEQAAICSQCRLILAFPEDLGGDVVDGPASIWSCHEYQMLEWLHEAERGAAWLCQLSSADHRGPSPTFPTRWCASAPVGERSRVRRSSEPGRRNLGGQSILAALFLGLGVRRCSFCSCGGGYYTTVCRTTSVFAPSVCSVVSLFPTATWFWLRYLIGPVVGEPQTSRSARRGRLFSGDSLVPDSFLGTSLAVSCEVSNWTPGKNPQARSISQPTFSRAPVFTAQNVCVFPSGVSGLVSLLFPCSSPLASDPSALSLKCAVPTGSGRSYSCGWCAWSSHWYNSRESVHRFSRLWCRSGQFRRVFGDWTAWEKWRRRAHVMRSASLGLAKGRLKQRFPAQRKI